MRAYDSNGPDVRIRGTAYQVTEKYETLAKDAETSGNFVLAENYRQHAEHYQRIINSFEEQESQNRKKFEIKDRDADQNEKEEVAVAETAEVEDDLALPASMIAEAPVEDVVTA